MPGSLRDDAGDLVGLCRYFDRRRLESEECTGKNKWCRNTNPEQEEYNDRQKAYSGGSSSDTQENVENGEHAYKDCRECGGGHDGVQFPILSLRELVNTC
mmetsp:Transcript_7909/g.19754  ORF Transcript_7909/g.19754 Transcript_7909/m.19754 type:complete len:100 (-) Transcript_7909:1702-2001(-)